MRERRKWWLLIGSVMLFAVALCAVGRLAGGSASPVSRPSGPLGVVLLPGVGSSELVVADIKTGRVVRRIRLRSLVTDIAVDASTGLVVAAQSGGIGPEADDALSVTDVRTGQVRYVTLPVIDPGDVACVGGRAYVLHSVVEASGSVVSVVDVKSGRVLGGGRVPDRVGLWSAAAGALWTATDPGGGAPALTRIGLDGFDLSVTDAGGPPVFGVTEAAGLVALLGPARSDEAPSEGLVRLMDPVSSSIVASAPVMRLARPPMQAVAVGKRLMVGDWNGEEPESHILEVFDSSTLQPMGVVSLDGAPCALAVWSDRLLAVDRVAGRLLVVDPADGRTLGAIDLGAKGLTFSDVVVIE